MALPTASDNVFPKLAIAEGGTLGTAAASSRRLGIDANGVLVWKDSGGTTSPLVALNKWDATAAPGTGDDNTAGYAVGSRWIDTTNAKEYVCLDASTGAAVWTETTAGGGSGSITASGYTQTTARLLGRTTASTGAIEEITVGTGLSLSAGSLTASGSVTSALVGCKAYNSTTQSVNNTTVALTFDSEEWDTNAFHSTVTNTSRMTIPSGKDGYYLLQAGSFASGGAAWIGFEKTVSGPTTTAVRGYQTFATGGVYRSASAIVQLAATDYVEAFVSTTNNITFGHATLPDAQSWFSITLLGT